MAAVPIDKQLSDLSGVLDVALKLGATSELEPLLELIASQARNVLDAERASVFQYDSKSNELFTRVATGTDREIRISVDGSSIAGAAASTNQIVNIPDAYGDSRFNREIDRQTGFRTRSILSVPLNDNEGRLVGVLQMLNKRDGQFDAYDQQLAAAFSAQAGVALQRAQLLEEYAQKQQMEQALQIARTIQQQLLPRENPRIPGFEVAGWSQACDETGGDCYDFQMLKGDRLAITLADATGHGVGPALVIAETRALLRAVMSLAEDVGQIIHQVNNLLSDDLGGDRFVTTFFGLLDPGDSMINYASAGQGPLLVYNHQQRRIQELPATGIPLGIMPDMEFMAEEPIRFMPGDMLVLLTDGFYEWSNPADELMGSQRIADVVIENAGSPAADLIDMIRSAVLEFSEGTEQKDDLTAVIVKKR